MVRRVFMAVAILLAAALEVHAQTAAGAALYRTRCASCHGAQGRGDGPFAAYLSPRPRDFTGGRYKVRSTETGSLPTDDDLVRSIGEGLHGTSMLAWQSFLSDAQARSIAGYLKSLSPRFATEPPRPIAVTAELPETPANVDAGRAVYERLKCAACHGADGKGTGAIAQALKDDWGYPTRATRLTEPWTFRGGATVRDIYLRFRTGMNGTPMPSFIGAATEPELWQLAVYVKSLGRRPVWEMNAEEVAAFYKERDEAAAKNVQAHGEYLVNITGCVFCHSPHREDGTMMEELRFAGGQKVRIVPFGEFVTYNLTSDKETGLGNWTDDQLRTFLTKGIRPAGSRMLPFPMPWPTYANMKPEDLNAIIAFLRTIPPASNRIPPPQAPNIVSYLIGKFRLLVLHIDPPYYVYPGNAGTAAGLASNAPAGDLKARADSPAPARKGGLQ